MVTISFDTAYNILGPLILFIFGLVIYSIIVYKIYKFVATRDIFNLNLRQYNTFEHPFLFKFFAVILYFLEYILFFPLFLMVWFVVFSILLMALTKTQSVETILLFSMAIISSIRIVSYYNQTLSKDLAKIIPFTLVAIFLTEGATSFFSWERSFELVKQIPSLISILSYYFVFVIFLELTLRIMFSFAKGLSEKDKEV